MDNSKISVYAMNCFWLLVPILIFNIIFERQLPPAFQMDVFWRGIPQSIGMPENVLRILVTILPFFMRLRASTPNQRLGLAVYGAGLLAYFSSWILLIVAPGSAWSRSIFGFMAPAYTPVVWLASIAMIGSDFLIPRIPFKPWMYLVLSTLFLCFHNLHTYIVYSRGT